MELFETACIVITIITESWSRIPLVDIGAPRALTDDGGLRSGIEMKIATPQLPYNVTDLEPALSREAVWGHFHRHQKIVFERATALIRDTDLGHLEVEDLLVLTAITPTRQALFRTAASYWNHHMFWRSMR